MHFTFLIKLITHLAGLKNHIYVIQMLTNCGGLAKFGISFGLHIFVKVFTSLVGFNTCTIVNFYVFKARYYLIRPQIINI